MTYVPKTEPFPQFPHGARDLANMSGRPGYAWFWQQGTGKSRELIDNTGMLYDGGEIDGLFLLAPNVLHRNFVTQELQKWLPGDMLDRARWLFWRGSKTGTNWFKDSCSRLLTKQGYTYESGCQDVWGFSGHRDGLAVLTMSYDSMVTDAGKAFAKEFLQTYRCIYGCDESQRIKSPDAWRTEVVLASAAFAPYRRIMSGTPVANAPWDVWTQIKFLDNDFWRGHGLDSIEAMKSQFGIWDRATKRVPMAMIKRGKSLEHFYREKGVPEELRTIIEPAMKMGPNGVLVPTGVALQRIPVIARTEEGAPAYKNLEQLHDILMPISTRVLKKDVLPDLPPKLSTMVEFELSPRQRQTYEQLKKLGFAELDGKVCTVKMALTMLLRLQQIACGYLQPDATTDEENIKVVPIVPNPRIELLNEIAQDLDHQALIWCRFRPDVIQICEALDKLGKSYGRYDGGLTEDECFETDDLFHKGKIQFIVGTYKGSEGRTLNEAQTALFYSINFKLIDFEQASDRPHRAGQKNAVNEIMFKARDTVDEKVVSSLLAKRDMAGTVTGDNLREWLA